VDHPPGDERRRGQRPDPRNRAKSIYRAVSSSEPDEIALDRLGLRHQGANLTQRIREWSAQRLGKVGLRICQELVERVHQVVGTDRNRVTELT
jgi:hypothetical protein